MSKVYLIASAFALFPFMTLGQDLPIDPETKLITYSEVVELPGVNKNDLYVRANTWFSRTFKSAKSVIEFQDKEAGKIIGKGITDVAFKNPPLGLRNGGIVRFTVTLQVKDGRYKYTISDLNHEAGTADNTISCGPLEQEKTPRGKMGMGFPAQFQWVQIKEDANADMKGIVDSLKKGMAKGDADF